VFAGVGERTREGNDLYKEMIESGVIKLGDKQVRRAPVCALRQSSHPREDTCGAPEDTCSPALRMDTTVYRTRLVQGDD